MTLDQFVRAEFSEEIVREDVARVRRLPSFQNLWEKQLKDLTLGEVADLAEEIGNNEVGLLAEVMMRQRCRVCGCTDFDCSQCIKKTGRPCSWVEEDLCSACQ